MFTLLLICAILTPLAFQPVSSQVITTSQTSTQYSTATTVTTGYSTTYSTATSTRAIHYERRPDDYNNATGSFTLGEYEETRRPFPLPFPFSVEFSSEYTCLYYDYFVFHAAKSQEIRGHLEAVVPVSFYVMNVDQLISFYGYFCGNYYRPSEFKAFTSSYDLDWIVPQDGVYVFLFTSHRPYVGHLTLYFTAYTYSTTTQTATLSYTVTGTHVFQNVETIVSIQGSTGTPQNTSEVLILAAMVVLVLIIGVSLIAIKTKRT